MKTSLTLFSVLFLSAISFGSTTCQSTFRAGNGNSQATITFCVTENGNIVYLNTGVLQIDGAEGYAVCGVGAGYWDLGSYGSSENWLPAVITQPGGPNTFPLTIARSSTDGVITLTQAFTFGSGKTSVHVKMTLTGGRAYGAIYRYADVQGLQQIGDHTYKTSFVWSSSQYGLMASPAASRFVSAGLLVGGSAPNICSPGSGPSLPYIGDAATLIEWTVPSTKPFVAAFDYVPMR